MQLRRNYNYTECNGSVPNTITPTNRREARLVKLILILIMLVLFCYYAVGSYQTSRRVHLLQGELQSLGGDLVKVMHQLKFAGPKHKPPPEPNQLQGGQVEEIVRRFSDKIHNEILLSNREISSLRNQVQSLKVAEQASGVKEIQRLMRPDFAAESVGGSIHSTGSTMVPMGLLNYLLGVRSSNAPLRIIQPTKAIGECYGYYGTVGEIVIRLQKRIFIEAISVDHISAEMSPSGSLDSAPKEIHVYGLELTDGNQHFFGRFEYELIPDKRLQTFDIPANLQSAHSFQYVQMWFQSNHGNHEYTCVYQVQVHGRVDPAKNQIK